MAGEISRAIIVGSEGQDGRILFDQLSSRGCDVLGLGRTSSRTSNGDRATHVDITSSSDVAAIVRAWRPDAVFYLPAVHRSSQEEQRESDVDLFEQSHRIHVT